MTISVSKISFTGDRGDRGVSQKNKKVGVTDAGLATGGAIGSFNYLKRFKRFGFNKVDDFIKLSNESAKAGTVAASTVKKTSSLFKNFKSNVSHYKELFINWSKATKLGKMIKPVIESRAYKGLAGIFGGIAAVFVFISGVGEMGEAISRYANK